MACCGVALCLIVGCDRSNEPAANGAGATTQPQAVANSVPHRSNPEVAQDPATTQPTSSTIIVDNRIQEWFPRAMLRLTKEDGQVVARLYSDDPSGVLSGKEIVNSYDLQMVLPDIDDPAKIAQAVWTSKSVTSSKQDTPFGIFLNDQRVLLQPMDVTVRFANQGPLVLVMLQGTFREFPMNSEMANPTPTMVQVIGALRATVPEK
jgi:hypothetical protein